MLYLGKLSEVSGLDTVLVSVENWWYSYYLFLLLMSLLIRDVAEMEEASFWKCDKILPHNVLNVFSTVHHELTIINDQLDALIIYFIHKYYSLHIFQATSAHPQEETVVYMHHMEPHSLRVPGGQSIQFSLSLCIDCPPGTLIECGCICCAYKIVSS